MATLSEDEVRGALEKLPGWELTGSEIVREFKFENFPGSIAFVVRLGFAAEKADHHPEWSNVYNNVEIVLSTHDAGGLSDKDVALAKLIDTLA